jgi:hypothetical protein
MEHEPREHSSEHSLEKEKWLKVLGDTKTAIEVAAIWAGPEAVRRTRPVREVDPRAAAQHTAITIFAAGPSATILGRPIIVLMPAILYPYPHIAYRIEQAKVIGCKTAHRGRTFAIPLTSVSSAVAVISQWLSKEQRSLL